MQTVTQLSLLPTTEPICWFILPPDTWEDYQSVNTVYRETEDDAFMSIRDQMRLLGKMRVMSLTPVHRRVANREQELMQRYSHYNEANAISKIAEEFGMTEKKVKKYLFQVSVMYKLLTATGMEGVLEAA